MVSNSNDWRLHEEKRMTAHEVMVVRPVTDGGARPENCPRVVDQQRHCCRCHDSVSPEWVTTVLGDPSGPAMWAAIHGMGVRCGDPAAQPP